MMNVMWFGLVGNIVGRINEVNERRARLVLKSVTVRRQAGEPSQYVTSHPGQLNLAIPPWVGAVSICKADMQTSTPHNALALYLWSGSVNWCLAED